MDISLKTPAALPGSQRQLLGLTQAPQALRLKAGQGLQLRVLAGRLWLTEDGQADDHFLGSGQTLNLHGPGCWRIGALDGDGVELTLQLSAGLRA